MLPLLKLWIENHWPGKGQGCAFCHMSKITLSLTQIWITTLYVLCLTRNGFNTLATWCEKQTHWKRPDDWERLKVKAGDRGWDGWMASPTQWTWIWANSWRWWRTEKPCLLHPWGHKELDMTKRLNNNKNDLGKWSSKWSCISPTMVSALD